MSFLKETAALNIIRERIVEVFFVVMFNLIWFISGIFMVFSKRTYGRGGRYYGVGSSGGGSTFSNATGWF